MTQGRKPNPTPLAVVDPTDPAALRRGSEALNVLSAASAEVMQSAELHKLLGRIEGVHFIETVSAKLIAQTYVRAKALLGEMGQVTVRGPDGTPETVSGMERFCELAMPVSARRCQQIVSNMELVGDTLFEQAERIGFRTRDYAALKALPAEDQAVVKQAIETGTREDVIDILADLAARNDALRKKSVEGEKALAAKDKVIAKKDAKLNELAERDELMATDEGKALEALRTDAIAAELALAKAIQTIDKVMANPPTEAAEVAARQTVDYLVRRMVDACSTRGITVDLADEVSPAWAEPINDAVATAAARKAKA